MYLQKKKKMTSKIHLLDPNTSRKGVTRGNWSKISGRKAVYGRRKKYMIKHSKT